MQTAGSGVPVSWQSDHTGSEGLTVVHGWIGTCSVAKEFERQVVRMICVSTPTVLSITHGVTELLPSAWNGTSQQRVCNIGSLVCACMLVCCSCMTR